MRRPAPARAQGDGAALDRVASAQRGSMNGARGEQHTRGVTVILDGRKVFASVIAAALCACVTTHPGNPALDAFPAGIVGTTDVTYYDIHGRSAGELVAEMRRLGPKTAIGQI